jgi:deazaflavin-dependent oxidoreductase (nitroreductase family)
MLSAPVVNGDQNVVVASEGGEDRDPGWYHNVVTNPEIELTMAGQRRPMRARPATTDEKAGSWPRIVAD